LKVPFYIAKRYVFSRSKSSAINFITGITAVGIFIGALVMFVVLSAFSGLREYTFQFINGFDPDLKLVTTVGKTFDFTPEKEQKLKTIEGIEYYSTFLEERVLLRYDSKEQIAYIKGVDENFEFVNPVEDFIYMGEWVPEANQAVVGYVIAQKLSIGIFDYESTLQIVVPKAGKGSLSQDDFSKVTVRPLGIYSFSDEDIDSRYVYTGLPLAQHLLQLDENKVSGIEFKLKKGASENKIKAELINIFGKDISIKNRMELNDTLHKMHNTENLVVYLIITLVIIITLFTLIGTIIMMIWDKKQNLKTLYSLGLQVKDLRKIFLYQGLLLSFLGCISGLVLGIIVVLLQQQYGFWMISPTLAYPVKFTFQNIIIVLLTIMILAFLASKIASDRVSEKLL